MSRCFVAGILGLGLVACTSAAARVPESRDAYRWRPGTSAVDRTLVAGTLIEARFHRTGATLTGTVSADVRNARRRVVIPAGSAVGLRIAPRRPRLLDVTSVTVRGQVYPLSSMVEGLPVGPALGARILFVLPEGFTAAPALAGAP